VWRSLGSFWWVIVNLESLVRTRCGFSLIVSWLFCGFILFLNSSFFKWEADTKVLWKVFTVRMAVFISTLEFLLCCDCCKFIDYRFDLLRPYSVVFCCYESCFASNTYVGESDPLRVRDALFLDLITSCFLCILIIIITANFNEFYYFRKLKSLIQIYQTEYKKHWYCYSLTIIRIIPYDSWDIISQNKHFKFFNLFA